MFLNEGGNIWPESSDYEQTVEMIDGLVAATNNLIKDAGLEVHVIGSSANPTQNVFIGDSLIGIYRERKQEFIPTKEFSVQYPAGNLPENSNLVPKKSGDLDVMVDANQAAEYFKTPDAKLTRQALDELLTKQGVKVSKKGVTVHVLVPFQNKYYQVDIKVVANASIVSQYHHHEIPPGSPYKGVNKQMMMNTLASSQNMLWSPDEGLYARDAAGKKAQLLSTDLDEIAKKLLGQLAKPGTQINRRNVGSVESIMDTIADENQRNEIFAKAKSSPSWQAATPDVGTKEWFSNKMRMLK